MAKVRQSDEWTESDAVAEVEAADPSAFVLETFPPEYVERISQFIVSSSVSQNREDGAAEGEPAETDSDLAHSLFITQKPVPEAVRSERRQRHRLRSGRLTSPSEREESEDDTSPSASPQDTRSKRKKKKKIKLRLPKYSFPFLKDKMPKLKGIFLNEVQNMRLHCSSMGGFFDCMRKLQQSYQTVEEMESNLPAIDMNGECISPISEGEEDNLGDEPMKVVAKKCFVVPSKVRHSQSWYSKRKRNGKGKQWREGLTNSGGKKPPGGWGVVLHKIPTKKPSLRNAQSSDLESSDDKDPSCRIVRERGTSNKRLTRQSVRAQTEMLKTNRRKRDSSVEKEKEDDSGPPQSPKECIQKCGVSNKKELSQEGQGDGEPEDQSFFQSDTNNAATSGESNMKKMQNDREDNESAEEDDNESQEEVEVQYAAASMNEESAEVEESPHLSQTISELELIEKNGMEESNISDSQQKKKKRKKSPEEHEKKKKKKKRTESNDSEEEDVEQLKCHTAAESLHDDVEIPTKKKKKRKGTEKEFGDGGEGEGFKNTEAFQENLEKTLESSPAKRKKHKKASERDESNTPEDQENPQKDDIEDHDAGQLVTKKKKKKKKKMREMSNMEGSNDIVAQSSDPLYEKKKRKSSLLSADVEGKAAHSGEEKHCPSRSVAAEKPGVSAGISAESAEITVGLDESNDKVRKKKKKRKMSDEQESVEKDLELDFEELKETCEEALSDTGVKKKKKKHRRNEAESATPVKGSESADARCSDEAAVLKKKREKNMQETPAAASEETESESLFEHASPSLDAPGKNGKKKKKGKSAHNVSLWSKEQCHERLITTKERHKTDRKEQKRTADCSFTTQLSKTSELPSPHSIRKNKPKNVKRTLHNPSEDFLTDSQHQ